MSRKRVLDVSLLENEVPTTEAYQYYRPGCYYVPQGVRHATPYAGTYTEQWQPICNTATYAVDHYGRAYYLSNFEHQFQVPSTTRPALQHEVIYHYYNDGDVEISYLPQIEKDDYDDEDDVDVSPRKRERFNDETDKDCSNDTLATLSNNRLTSDVYRLTSDVYRSKEGYLVEEPIDNVSENL